MLDLGTGCWLNKLNVRAQLSEAEDGKNSCGDLTLRTSLALDREGWVAHKILETALVQIAPQYGFECGRPRTQVGT